MEKTYAEFDKASEMLRSGNSILTTWLNSIFVKRWGKLSNQSKSLLVFRVLITRYQRQIEVSQILFKFRKSGNSRAEPASNCIYRSKQFSLKSHLKSFKQALKLSPPDLNYKELISYNISETSWARFLQHLGKELDSLILLGKFRLLDIPHYFPR